ncbi:MAG: hypothetical protein JNM98_15145 [Rhodocyclaceae bacterium]|nr:hypothetical protein [Rhodocyclaceae bacterium]
MTECTPQRKRRVLKFFAARADKAVVAQVHYLPGFVAGVHAVSALMSRSEQGFCGRAGPAPQWRAPSSAFLLLQVQQGVGPA